MIFYVYKLYRVIGEKFNNFKLWILKKKCLILDALFNFFEIQLFLLLYLIIDFNLLFINIIYTIIDLFIKINIYKKKLFSIYKYKFQLITYFF